MPYSEAFRAQMVKKMLPPNGWSARGLSQEVGVPQSTLSRWLRDVRSLPDVTKPKEQKRSPKKWTPEEKLRVVTEAARLSDDELGGFLRREGVREEQLSEWREAVEEALRGSPKRRRGTAEGKRVKQLERELRRKEKALAEVSALLVLEKKLAKLWGDEDDDTSGKNEK